MFSECYILHWGGKKGKEKKISFSPIFLSFFHLLSKGKTIWKANLGSLWWFNLTTNWFLSSFFQIVVGHQWMLRQLLACLIPLIKGHCGSKTETNGFFILHLSALQSNGTGSPLRVFLFRCIVSSFNKVKRGGGRGWRKKESNPIFLVPVSYVAWSDFFFFSWTWIRKSIWDTACFYESDFPLRFCVQWEQPRVYFFSHNRNQAYQLCILMPYLIKKQLPINFHPFISLCPICFLLSRSDKPEDGEK